MTDWRREAACRGLKPSMIDTIFFPTGGTFGKEEADYSTARTYCDRCPVREQCLQIAMEAEHGVGTTGRYGFFGGATPRERYMRDCAGEPLAGELRCRWCDVPFTPSRSGQYICSRLCSRSYQAKLGRKRMAERRAQEQGAA